jgi:prepilin-type N-terminal cleavage/methylation domain-containing protein/prepilin-type processing-associated H-X9-DG protein
VNPEQRLMHEAEQLPSLPPRRLAACHRPRIHSRGFTLIELLVVVAIIGLLTSILLPSLAKSRQQGKRAVCAANLHQMGVAMSMYVIEHAYYPGDHLHREPNSIATWPVRLMKYIGKQNRTFWCPNAPRDTYWNGRDPVVSSLYYAKPGEQGTFGYGYNAWGAVVFSEPQLGLGGHVTDPEANEWEKSWNQGELRAEKVRRPAEMIAITDSDSDCENASPGAWDELVNPIDYPSEGARRQWPGNRHEGAANIVFADTHVNWMPQSDLVKANERIRHQWNNDSQGHCELWPDLPPGYDCPSR